MLCTAVHSDKHTQMSSSYSAELMRDWQLLTSGRSHILHGRPGARKTLRRTY